MNAHSNRAIIFFKVFGSSDLLYEPIINGVNPTSTAGILALSVYANFWGDI